MLAATCACIAAVRLAAYARTCTAFDNAASHLSLYITYGVVTRADVLVVNAVPAW